jgi:exodeoxyribonuclease III
MIPVPKNPTRGALDDAVRVITLNANGIRAAARKGFFTWVAGQNADVIAIQETKAQEHQLPEASVLGGYTSYYVDALRRGYSGVALYARREPVSVRRGLGWPDMDAEGRFVQADFGGYTISSLYVPSGTSGPVRQAVKMNFLERFLTVLMDLRNSNRPHLICGDFNVAHKEIDTFDPVRNASVTGFLPEEREWMDAVIDQIGWVDAFRVVNHDAKQYSWWANWPGAWQNNLGWRIDYHMITPGLAGRVKRASIYRAERFSDHAPVIVDYDL